MTLCQKVQTPIDTTAMVAKVSSSPCIKLHTLLRLVSKCVVSSKHGDVRKQLEGIDAKGQCSGHVQGAMESGQLLWLGQGILQHHPCCMVGPAGTVNSRFSKIFSHVIANYIAPAQAKVQILMCRATREQCSLRDTQRRSFYAWACAM